MKMIQVNGPALEAAIKAIGGEDGFHMVDRAYTVLDDYERKIRDEIEDAREVVFKEGFSAGYDYAGQAFYGAEQPDVRDKANPPSVIYLPDESQPELPLTFPAGPDDEVVNDIKWSEHTLD